MLNRVFISAESRSDDGTLPSTTSTEIRFASVVGGGTPPRQSSPSSRRPLANEVPRTTRRNSTSKSMSAEILMRQDTYKNKSHEEIPVLLAHVNVAERASYYHTEDITVPPAICPYCRRVVYSAEELHAVGAVWHKSCFVCGGSDIHGCSRILGLDNFVSISGVQYCRACSARYSKLSSNLFIFPTIS
jgi:LIM domain